MIISGGVALSLTSWHTGLDSGLFNIDMQAEFYIKVHKLC